MSAWVLKASEKCVYSTEVAHIDAIQKNLSSYRRQQSFVQLAVSARIAAKTSGCHDGMRASDQCEL